MHVTRGRAHSAVSFLFYCAFMPATVGTRWGTGRRRGEKKGKFKVAITTNNRLLGKQIVFKGSLCQYAEIYFVQVSILAKTNKQTSTHGNMQTNK